MNAQSYLEKITVLFDTYQIPALMIGNAAAALHGAPVTTLDFDFLVPQDDFVMQFRKLLLIARELGYQFQEIERTSGGYRMFRMQDLESDFCIDILYEADGLEYQQAFARSTTMIFAGKVLHVADLEDILLSKKTAGRKKDVATIPILEMTLDEKKRLEKNRSDDCGISC